VTIRATILSVICLLLICGARLQGGAAYNNSAQSAAGPSQAEIIDRIASAAGGLDALRSVRTERITARISFGPNNEGPLLVEVKRPGKIREEIGIQGKTIIRGYDGQTAWQVNPFSGKADAETLGPEDTRHIAEEAEIEGPLVDHKQKGNIVELMGKEKIDGRDAYKFKVALKSGDLHYYYFDCDSYLKVKWEAPRVINGGDVMIESFFGDYRKVNGLMVPFLIKSGARGSSEGQRIVTEKVEINPGLDDSRFRKPETGH